LTLEHSEQGCALVPMVGSFGDPKARAVRGAAAVVHAAHSAGLRSAALRDTTCYAGTPGRFQAPCLKRNGVRNTEHAVGQFEQQDLRVVQVRIPNSWLSSPAMLVGVLNSTPSVRVRQPIGH
jgi:hypothetical protein